MAKTKSDKEMEDAIESYITKKVKGWEKSGNKKKSGSDHASSGSLYFIGFIGALVYWMQAASGFGEVLTGFVKAMVWPAYVAYKLLESFYGVVV